MICPRCATTMIKRQDGTPYCYPCWEAAGEKIASTEPLATAPRTPYRVITAAQLGAVPPVVMPPPAVDWRQCPDCLQMVQAPDDRSTAVCEPCGTRIMPRPRFSGLSPSGEAFRLLQERVAKLESAMADVKRRPEPPARPRFLGQLAEEPRLGEPGEKG